MTLAAGTNFLRASVLVFGACDTVVESVHVHVPESESESETDFRLLLYLYLHYSIEGDLRRVMPSGFNERYRPSFALLSLVIQSCWDVVGVSMSSVSTYISS